MKKNYTKVCKFSFDNKTYTLFVDDDNKYFFLRNTGEDSYSYITEEELVQLQEIFCKKPEGYDIRKDRFSFTPKIISVIAAGATLLTLQSCKNIEDRLLYGRYMDRKTGIEETQNEKADYPNKVDVIYDNSYEKSTPSSDDNTPSLEDTISTMEERSNEDGKLRVDTYYQSERLHYIYIYDLDYLNLVLNYPKEDVTLEVLIKAINDNPNISPKFKELLTTYVTNFKITYPDADARVLNENLKTLKVYECTKNELIGKSISVDSYGCYRKDENAIYVLKDYDYIPGTWEYQVIMHEFSHAAKSARWTINGNDVRVSFEKAITNGVIVEEALNSLFAVRMYDQDELDIAYQLQSNYFEIILCCMDNYTLTDFLNHSFSYFEQKLNETTGTEEAVKMMTLIDAQYDDYHSERIHIEQEEFYPLYDYISNMYCKKFITPNMTYDEAKVVFDQMINRLTFDVSEKFELDINHFYEFFDGYCSQIGIAKGISR